jgi:hypothetical protein
MDWQQQARRSRHGQGGGDLTPIMPANVSIEQNHDLWLVAWRKPRSRPRFLPSQIALYEAQMADKRGDVELAARLRWAAIEAQSRNAL